MENLRFETQERLGDTIGEVAYRRIRSHIVNGQLLPDSKLKLDRMKEIYGASVTTLREILNRLAVEELVTAEGQRGFRVAAVSEEEFQELAALRALLGYCQVVGISLRSLAKAGSCHHFRGVICPEAESIGAGVAV